MTSEKEVTRIMGGLEDLKASLSYREISSRASAMGIEGLTRDRLANLSSGRTPPTPEILGKLGKIVKTLAKETRYPAQRVLEFRVTKKQATIAKMDPKQTAISIRGLRGTTKEPFGITLFGSHELPLLDVCIWRAHVLKYRPDSTLMFDHLWTLLKISPCAWLECMVTIDELQTETI